MKKNIISKDINVSNINESYKTKCVKCGKEIELYWNGGELDYSYCCGYDYWLEHKIVTLVVKNG